MGSVIAITLPSAGAFFTTYEALRHTLSESISPNSTIYLPQPAINAISSGGAELVSCAILTPAEVIKQNAQVIMKDGSRRRGSPTLRVLKQFKNQPARLWRGYTALAGRNLPFTGLQFPIFEYLKTYFLEQRKHHRHGEPVTSIFDRATTTAMSAAIAGSGAAWITTPIDVVKTRIMLSAGDEMAKSVPAGESKNQPPEISRKSGWLVAREILRNESIQGLFRGAVLRSAWTAVGSGLYLGCYEGGRFYLEDQRKAANANEGDSLMQKDWKGIKIGIGSSRSQDVIKKSAWQDD